jgi:ketosteroid isomerase-like protein
MLKSISLAVPLMFSIAAHAASTSSPEALFQAVQAAERAGDVATLRTLVGPAFVQHHASGVMEPRDAYLADHGAPAANPARGRGYLERDVQWRNMGNTAVRTSIARIRGARPGEEIWVRATAVMTREGRGWQLVDLDSALLYEGPAYEAPPEPMPATRFASKEGGAFQLLERGGQPYFSFQGGREIPLIAIGKGIYWAGPGSTLILERGPDGTVVAVRRRSGDRIAWRAVPVSHPDSAVSGAPQGN